MKHMAGAATYRWVALALLCWSAMVCPARSQPTGVATGIPEPQQQNVIVQLFNWRFDQIEAVVPRLKELGYSHIHVSPPQKSNERVWQWWGRYQPIDFSVIGGPLGDEASFKRMIDAVHQNGIKILIDVVANHTLDLTELPEPDFVKMDRDRVVSEKFPQFEPQHFRSRCNCNGEKRRCWLENKLLDLKTEDEEVRNIIKGYLKKLADLGVDGFRFDAAKHIEPDFFRVVLAAAPEKYAFGEIIAVSCNDFQDYLPIEPLNFYDFPLAAEMRAAFAFGGDLGSLKTAQSRGTALPGPRAVTFVRNHDIERSQANDRGLDRNSLNTFCVGFNAGDGSVNRDDMRLAYAFILGREDGFPYVFVGMPEPQDDRFDNPEIVAAVRFHNLCLANPDGSGRHAHLWHDDSTPSAISWQRGNDRFVAINKAAEEYTIRERQTTLQSGTYKDVRTGWELKVTPTGRIAEWKVPPRKAVMFVRTGD